MAGVVRASEFVLGGPVGFWGLRFGVLLLQ